MVVVEDMRPYNMRINDNVINTIKFIGETQWRLKSHGVPHLLFPRWEVKQWVYNSYRDMCLEEIGKKIEYAKKRYILKNGPEATERKRTASFVYVDDRVVEKAMKLRWDIKKPKVGEGTPFGLKTHSWQGLALATFYIERHDPSFLLTSATS